MAKTKDKSKVVNTNKINNYFGKSSHKIYCDSLLEQVQQSTRESEPKETRQNSLNPSTIGSEKEATLEEYDALRKKCKDLELQNSKLVKDNRALKKLLDASKSTNLYKDLKITRLKASNSVAESSEPKSMLFKDYESYFTHSEMKGLRSFGKGKRKDAAFITSCVKFVYQGDVVRIRKKCSGDRRIKGKEPISPDKKELLTKMFNERLEADQTNDENGFERCGRLNRLIGDAIYNLTKRQPLELKHESTSNAQVISESNVMINNTQPPTTATLGFITHLQTQFGSTPSQFMPVFFNSIE